MYEVIYSMRYVKHKRIYVTVFVRESFSRSTSRIVEKSNV